MKKLLFIFLSLLSFSSYGQAVFDEGIQNSAASTLNPISHIATQDANGLYGKVLPENIPITILPPTTHYTPVTPTLGGHLKGVDQALGNIVQTTAGVTNRIWFTADQTTITSGTFYVSNPTGKGGTASAIQSVTNDDNQKKYFTQDLISAGFPTFITYPSGIYGGQLSSRISTNIAQQRYTVEAYKCNAAGTPIASGVTGAPIGALGVTVIAVLDSGLVNVVAGNVTGVPVSGVLGSPVSFNAGERVRYHVSAEKSGTAGSTIDMEVFYGSDYNSYYDAPVVFNTTSIVNASTVTGTTATNALDNLNSGKEDVANKATDFTTVNNIKYPSVQAVKTYADAIAINETTGVFSNIQTLINNNPAGTSINLKPNTIYTQQNGLLIKEGVTINGNGSTLKRDTQQTTTTTVSATQASTTLTVSSIPVGWAIGDYVHVYTNTLFTTASRGAKITNIAGNVISLANALVPSSTPTYTWAIGSTVRKVYDQVLLTLDGFGEPVITSFTINNLTVDGNYTNNNGNYYWAVNTAVRSQGRVLLNKCKFINIPNENVMGHGYSIKNSYAENLNGSFIHQSIYIAAGDLAIGGEISGNTVKNTNIVSSLTASGHSEGVITFSFTSGRIAIHGNRFLGGGGSVLGTISNSTNILDGGNKDFIFNDNYCENFTKIVNSFDYTSSGFVTNVDNLSISDNIFSNCGVSDWGLQAGNIASLGVMKFTGNILTNGTIVSNIPEKMKEGFLLSGGTVNRIPKYNPLGYLVDGAWIDNGSILEATNPIFKLFPTQGTTASPYYDKVLYGGINGANESSILFGNSFANNNGTYMKLRVNSTAGSSTPIDALTINPDGSANFVSTVSGSNATSSNHFITKGQFDAAVTSGIKRYVALISQSGTSAPTVTVLENSLGFTPTFGYTSAGLYDVASASGFTSNKTCVILQAGINSRAGATVAGVSSITLTSQNSSGTLTDGILNNNTLKIEVYP